MPACARKLIVRDGEIAIYHGWSRCVQRALLCGKDPVTGVDFNYRRQWIEDLLEYQASVFAVDVGNFSVLSNHTHLIATPAYPDSLHIAIGETHRRYSRMINFREGWQGWLCRGKFSSFIMEGIISWRRPVTLRLIR